MNQGALALIVFAMLASAALSRPQKSQKPFKGFSGCQITVDTPEQAKNSGGWVWNGEKSVPCKVLVRYP